MLIYKKNYKFIFILCRNKLFTMDQYRL